MAWKPGKMGARPRTPKSREFPVPPKPAKELITPDMLLEMIGLRCQGWTYQELSNKYGIPLSTIHHNFKSRDREVMRGLKANDTQEAVRQLDAMDRMQKRIWEQLEIRTQTPADTCRLVTTNQGILEDIRKIRGIGEFKDPRTKPNLPGEIDLDFDAADAGAEDDDGEAEDQTDARQSDRAATPLLGKPGSVQGDDRGNREREEQSGISGSDQATGAQHGNDCGPIVEDAPTVNP